MLENVSYVLPLLISDKITNPPKLYSKLLLFSENKHHIVNVQIKWNCLIPFFCLLWLSFTCFRLKNVSYILPLLIVDKITNPPKLYLKVLLFNENKHQIMNVHIKWNCLIPSLSTLVEFYLFQA